MRPVPTSTPETPPASGGTRFKVRGLRWYIVILLCLASELNYLDRQTLSVLAQTIQDELHITTIQYADITFAFLISYTGMYAVSGWIVDRLGSRKSFLVFVSSWSVATMLHAFAHTAGHFMACRALLGVTEPANFPGGVKAVTQWFPMRERALAVGIFNAGTAVGAAVAAPVVAWIALHWGWRMAFVFTGVLGFAWVVAWAIMYRLPREHRWLGADELAVIESDQVSAAEETSKPTPVLRLLGMKEVWGCILARMLTDPISYFFIFWTPKFLQQERGFDLADVGRYSWIPFVALAFGNIAGGAVPSWLTRRGWALNRARKTTMLIASCAMPVCCLLVTRVSTASMAVALITIAMFAHAAWANITLPAEVFPHRVVGLVTGLGGAMGGLVGALSQKAIGWTVQNISFTPIFTVCSVMHLTAFALVCLLIGEIGRTRELPA